MFEQLKGAQSVVTAVAELIRNPIGFKVPKTNELFVTQRPTTVSFTFDLPMTIPPRLQETLSDKIDLLFAIRVGIMLPR